MSQMPPGGPGQMPPTGPPPPGYGYGAGYGYATPAYNHPNGTKILVLGILSLVLCQVLGPVAWVMGNNALREIDAAGGVAANRGNVVAGRVCGIIASVLLILGVLLWVGILVFAAALGSSSN